MIYSIGYQNLKRPEQLVDILMRNNIELLMDVRSRPYSRNKKYNKQNLKMTLSKSRIKYYWAGSTLGGFSTVSEDNIKLLADFQKDMTICLMCMEADPKKCHRDYEIARRIKKYGVEVTHLHN